MNLRIRDLVDVPPVQTVIRLEDGANDAKTITSSFVCTEEVTNHFTMLGRALQRDSGGGFFLEGDFGSGKSHFLAAFSAWLDDRSGAETLSGAVPALAECKLNNRRFLPVEISLVKFRSATPIERIITSAIESALSAHHVPVVLSPFARFRERLAQMLGAPAMAAAFKKKLSREPDTLDQWFVAQPREAYVSCMTFLKEQGIERPEDLIEERHEVFSRALDEVCGRGFCGIVVVIDELSEFFRSKPDAASLNEDARTLQLLGEIASSRPLWVIAAVQESIERTGDIASATFRKIKDRFPVRFRLSTLHIRDLIGRRLVKHRQGADERILVLYNEYRRNFPQFSCPLEQFLKMYPIHPATLTLLEGLGDLFSQHRGIVDFVHARLAGDPGRSITGILDAPADELLAPDAIYDHFAPRLAEISAFHVYPLKIVPHLDETISRVIEEEGDRVLARRLVRMLVLYSIHPTAEKPTARILAELCACMLAPHSPDANVEFVTGVLLDPIAAQSRFLNRRTSPTGNPLDTIYTVTTQEDYSGIFRQRLEKAMAEVRGDDSRIILEPIGDLAPDMSWPGPQALHEGAERTVTWRQTLRRVFVVFVHKGAEAQIIDRIERLLESGSADFVVAMVAGDLPFACRHTAVWRFNGKGDGGGVLAECFAAKQIAAELHPSNPSHAPLIPLVNDLVRRTAPLVRTVLMDLFYAGSFDGEGIMVDASALQVRRFDRLLEAAAEKLLEERYPRFNEIAPRLLQPSSRLYQRIVEEFVAPGTLSLSEARAKSLTEAIETLVTPLGLAEVKSGAYRLSPALGEHPFLTYVFSLLRAAGPTPRGTLMFSLRFGAWGVPQETAEFLLVALAHSGAMTLIRGGRTVPLDLLPVTSVESVDAVAPGEIISQADRETLTGECRFLSPQGGWNSFGLRQQREAWLSLIKLKNSFQPVLEETARYLESTARFEAFASLDFEAIGTKAQSIAGILSEVMVSYQAREGLERFLSAWRASGLGADDVELVKQAHRFFSRLADKFIYVSHYVRHRSVERASDLLATLAERREAVLLMLKDPMNLVLPDDGIQFGTVFDLFREEFAQLYIKYHREFSEALRPAALSRQEQRVLSLFEKLNRIEALDRPSGLDDLIRSASGGGSAPPCNRRVAEELLRSPSCGCGFTIGDQARSQSTADRSKTMERCFMDYLEILSSADVLEAVTAHAYAMRDMDATASDRLDRLCGALRDGAPRASAPLLDLLDDRTIAEIGRALSGSMKVKGRSLGDLITGLAGRRLTIDKARAVFDAWTGSIEENTLLSFDAPPAGAGTPTRPLWWALLHPGLLPVDYAFPDDEARVLERALEEQFPSVLIEKHLSRLDDAHLLEFITGEPLHTGAIRMAWSLFIKRALRSSTVSVVETGPSRHMVAQEATAIMERLAALGSMLEAQNAPFPLRLRGRVPATALWSDDWSTRDLKKSIESQIATIAEQASDWLSTLAPPGVIDLHDAPAVIIVDALPPDVWLQVAAQLGPLISGSTAEWSRLSVAPQTVPSLAALFGFAPGKDPLDEFRAAGAVYHSIKGDEQHPLVELLPPIKPAVPLIVRFSLLDNAAHTMNMPLHALPRALSTMLTRHLLGIIALCKEQKRRLVLTADHGLTWKSGRLLHGQGGVFEETIVRVEWRF